MAVYIQSPLSGQWLQLEKQSNLCFDVIVGQIKKWHLINSDSLQFKLFRGCEEIIPGISSEWPTSDVFIKTTIPLVGGKGGFGSMLRYSLFIIFKFKFINRIFFCITRAIGAQIEKTTNREACRDLSGRRLRDINEEKR